MCEVIRFLCTDQVTDIPTKVTSRNCWDEYICEDMYEVFEAIFAIIITLRVDIVCDGKMSVELVHNEYLLSFCFTLSHDAW
jgi:hypothetical protein